MPTKINHLKLYKMFFAQFDPWKKNPKLLNTRISQYFFNHLSKKKKKKQSIKRFQATASPTYSPAERMVSGSYSILTFSLFSLPKRGCDGDRRWHHVCHISEVVFKDYCNLPCSVPKFNRDARRPRPSPGLSRGWSGCILLCTNWPVDSSRVKGAS